MTPGDMECVLVLRGRKTVAAEGKRGGGLGQTEARNRVAPLQSFLNSFQRLTSQISETKTTLTAGMAIRMT